MPDTNNDPEVSHGDKELLNRVAELESAITELKMVEKALRESEQFITGVFDSVQDGISVLTPDLTILHVNETMNEWYKEHLPLEGRKCYEVYQNSDKPCVPCPTLHCLESGNRELNVVPGPSESPLEWIELFSFPIKDPVSNEITGVVEFVRDITKRKLAESKLENAASKWRSTFEAMSDSVWIVDLDGNILEHNSASLEMFGISDKDIRNKHCWEIVHGLSEPIENCPLLRMKVTKTRESMTFLEKGRWLEVSVDPIMDDAGQLKGTVHVVSDITERKLAEVALSEANNIINLSPVVAFKWRIENGWSVEFVSENVEKLTGYTSQEFLENKISYKDLLHADDVERVAEEVDRHSKMESLHTYEHAPYRIVTRNGDIKWIDDRTHITRDPRGIITHYEGIVFDITERIKLGEQLRQAQKMESVGRLAGGVAHDFNNMLGVILGHTEMAMKQVDPAQPLNTHLAEICAAAERSADLTRQLLAFARKQTIAPMVLDLNETVEGMLKMLNRLISENIELTWHPGAEVWPVKMDPVQIDQILANLCVNARDSIEGVGKITIETGNVILDRAYCAVHPGSAEGEYVMLAVSDNGFGMDKETLSMLFEPFFTTKDRGKGTGLGLATIYGIVKQNDGYIEVDSEPGHGTTFRIYLPRNTAELTAKLKKGPEKYTRQGQETILLVEDEQSIMELIALMLERQGYTVLAACTPSDAIRLAEDHPGEIHLLITDVVMPEMNGRDLARNVMSFYPGISCLFMSGYTADIIAHQGVLNEGVHFIQKPFRNQDLAVKVREVLESE